MKKILLPLVAVSLLAACSSTQVQTALATPAGQLFCAVQTSGGGTVVAGMVDAEASALSPAAAPVVIIATGLTKAKVDADCTAAGGIAVVPPANPAAAPQVAVVASK